MNEWADLHGETFFDIEWQRKAKNNIYCYVCCDWIPKEQIKIWTGDDMKHYLCTDCDSDLMPAEFME